MLATPSHQRHGTRGDFAKSPGTLCVKGPRERSCIHFWRHAAPRHVDERDASHSAHASSSYRGLHSLNADMDFAKTIATFGSGCTSMPRESKGLTDSLRLRCAVT